MKEFKFNTTIKCTGCLDKVRPFLDELKGVESWEVDIYTPEKPLTVLAKEGSSDEIIRAVQNAGFEILEQ